VTYAEPSGDGEEEGPPPPSPRLRNVQAVVGGSGIGTGLVVSYDGDKSTGKIYTVPLYRMTVSGKDAKGNRVSKSFEVIRFGVWDKNNKYSVVGLAEAQVHTLTWAPGFLGGSWLIYEKVEEEEVKRWFVHRGAADPSTVASPAIGCIEVTGSGEWKRFSDLVKRLSGASTENQISQAKTFSIRLEATTRPPLTLSQ
jgi:hypothetical protein